MRHVVTIVSPASRVIDGEAIVNRFSAGGAWRWLEAGVALDMMLAQAPSAAQRAQWQEEAAAQGVDILIQPEAGREKRLLISDMDSTMIAQECIDELADTVGQKAHVAAITERAMNGELDFAEALRERVGLLKGVPEAVLQEVFAQKITFTHGARTLVQTMRARGAQCLLVSGGFRFFTARVAAALGFHADEANQLEVVDGVLTGRVLAPILDKQSKLEALRRACAQLGLSPEAALAVGDGANDLPMLQAAGLGVAYYAKPVVQKQCAARLLATDLTTLLYAQGIAKSEWVGE